MGVDWEKQPRDRITGRWTVKRDWNGRTCVIRMRLTEAEREMIERNARRTGQSMTAWIMQALHAAAVTPDRTGNNAPSMVSAHQKRIFARRRQRRQGWP